MQWQFGTFCGHLVYTCFPVLVRWTNKILATLFGITEMVFFHSYVFARFCLFSLLHSIHKLQRYFLFGSQGDQIGRIFATWAIVRFGQFLWKFFE
jgi:hypothetical protein